MKDLGIKSIFKIMQQDNVRVIKERLDIVDFLRGYLKLTPAGKNLKATCPFHKENTPSFMVSPDRQIWHCFGCAAGGDIFSFVMKYENLEFFEALKMLAEKAGIELRQTMTGDQRRLNVLYEINNSAKEFFIQNLSGAPLQYLLSRGLKKETLAEFKIGFAPNGSDFLLRHLMNAGYAVEEVERAGLVFKTERGTYWDRFRNRVVFPLSNHFGKTVGFTGRILPQTNADLTQTNADMSAGSALSPREPVLPKYVNSPETPIFNKSKVLFGFDKSKTAIREVRAAILVEGQMDFLMLWQDGVKNAVATSGTALTQDHLTTLRRVADSLILIFDSDEAGQAATERAIDLAAANDFSAQVVLLKSEKDPADFIKDQHGKFIDLVKAAVPATEFYFSRYLKNPGGIADQKRNLRVILSKIKNIYSPVERGHWLKQLSLKTGVREDFLLEEMNRIKTADLLTQSLPETDNKEKLSRKELISDQLIGLALNCDLVHKLQPHLEYLAPAHQTAVVSGLKNLDNQLALRVSFAVSQLDLKKTENYFDILIRELKREYFKEKRSAVSQAIRAAEINQDETALTKAKEEFNLINEEMQNI